MDDRANTRRAPQADDGGVDEGGSGLAALVIPVGLGVLVGFGLPVGQGWVWPMLALIVAVAAALWRDHHIAGWIASHGSLSRALHGHPPWRGLAVVALAILPTAILITVLGRTVAALWVAFPAAWWALPVLLMVSAVVGRVTRLRARAAAAVVLAMAIPVAGGLGAAYEAQGEDARGWAHSGPIHGIHPFQITAIIIDGFGPFDIPINDYVEPDGSRGYGPAALADALERALHRIAVVHYAQGPARAHMAFAGAEVEHVTTEPVRERLDREGTEQSQHRFVVHSGTFGRGSRVEFVCPGRREDPRGHPGDNVMTRMCPDKYASEASAGLGVTGRWPGYVEGRGNGRSGIAAWLGWTRSDDSFGQAVVARELRWGAWAVLGLLGALVAARLRPRRVALRTSTADGLRWVVAGLLGLAITLTVVFGLGGQGTVPAVAPIEAGPGGGVTLLDWLGLLAVYAASSVLGPTPPRTALRLRGVVFVPLFIVTLLGAAHLASTAWIVPRLASDTSGLALEAWVGHVADTVGEPGGRSILEIEGAVAATVVAVLLGLGVALLQRLAGLTGGLWPSASRTRPASGLMAVGLAVLLAAFLVVSRKTEGATALVPGAIGLMILLASYVHTLSRAGRPGWGIVATAHVVWTGVALVLLFQGIATVDSRHTFVMLCAAVGSVTAIFGLTALVRAAQTAAAAPRPHPDASA